MYFRARIIYISRFGLHALISITISNIATIIPITIFPTSNANIASIMNVIQTLITLATYIQ